MQSARPTVRSASSAAPWCAVECWCMRLLFCSVWYQTSLPPPLVHPCRLQTRGQARQRRRWWGPRWPQRRAVSPGGVGGIRQGTQRVSTLRLFQSTVVDWEARGQRVRCGHWVTAARSRTPVWAGGVGRGCKQVFGVGWGFKIMEGPPNPALRRSARRRSRATTPCLRSTAQGTTPTTRWTSSTWWWVRACVMCNCTCVLA